jgi:hypothetical protein
MRTSEDVDTRFGPASVPVIVCDTCGRKITMQSISSWDVPSGWSLLTRRTADGLGAAKSNQDFCSDECVVRSILPGIYDEDPHVVVEAVGKLKQMARDLDSH